MSNHIQSGRTTRMIAAAIKAAIANPDEPIAVVFKSGEHARWARKCRLQDAPSNLHALSYGSPAISSVDWANGTVKIGVATWPAFFDHSVAEDVFARMQAEMVRWNAKPGEYGYDAKKGDAS